MHGEMNEFTKPASYFPNCEIGNDSSLLILTMSRQNQSQVCRLANAWVYNGDVN